MALTADEVQPLETRWRQPCRRSEVGPIASPPTRSPSSKRRWRTPVPTSTACSMSPSALPARPARAGARRDRRAVDQRPRFPADLGLPVDRLGADDASWIYWGVGMHLGVPWAQNAKGHLLGDVRIKEGSAATARGSEIGGVRSGSIPTARILSGCSVSTRACQGREPDRDFRLLCPQLLAASDPELAGALYEGLPHDFRGAGCGRQALHHVPAFSRQGGVCSLPIRSSSCVAAPRVYTPAHRHAEGGDEGLLGAGR